MAGLGWQELVIVLVIIMIIFGAGKLPEVARSLGQGVREFKNEANDAVEGTSTASATTATATGATVTGAAVADSPTTVIESETIIDDGVAPAEPRDTRADQV